MRKLIAALGIAALVSLGVLVNPAHANVNSQSFAFTYNNPLGLTDPNGYALEITWQYPTRTITSFSALCYPAGYANTCTSGKTYTINSAEQGVPETACWGTFTPGTGYLATFSPLYCTDASQPGPYSYDYVYLGT